MPAPAARSDRFLVACLCAEWCGICRDYRQEFLAMASDFPDARFCWIDIEDHADLLDEHDIDVENFPTLHIQRGNDVLFFGTMLPHHAHLRRTLEVLHAQTADESRSYAQSTAERSEWQKFSILGEQLAER